MCRSVFAVWMILAFLLCEKASAAQYAFRITFSDKNNTPYTLGSPLAYLSARSVARRTTQSIAIDSTDLPVSAAYIDSVLTLTGGKLHTTSRWLNMCTILLQSTDSANILALAGKPFITNVELVAFYTADLHNKPAGSHTSYPVKKTTGLDSPFYGATWDQTELVHGNYLHENGFMGQGKLIAVLDAGFVDVHSNPGFDSMWNSGRVVDSFDFVWHSGIIVRQDVHGEEVLSTMAGYWPGTFVGTAPLASYALYLTENNINDQPIELDNLICASERADSIGADIITESLGYDLFDYPPGSGQDFATDLDGKTTIGAKAANLATKKGMLFVATAGNDGGGYLTWGNHILTPGDADSALTIGSTTNTGTIWATSGYGPNAAGQVKPDVAALGHVASILYSTGVSAMDGTSFSTPQIAGWAACLWQANPNATPYQLRQAIIKCASSYSSPGTQIGYGVPDFHCTEQVLNVVDTPPPFTQARWLLATPNPFTGQLKIAVSPNSDNNITFHLFDITGRTVCSFTTFCYMGYNAPFYLPLPELPTGMYILKATSPTQQQIIKLEKR
jgi:serine protease AprX